MAPFWLSRLSRYLICENRRRCEVDVVAVQVQRDDSGGSRAAEWVEDDTGHNVRATRACGLPAKCPGLHDGLARLALAEMGGENRVVRPVAHSSADRHRLRPTGVIHHPLPWRTAVRATPHVAGSSEDARLYHLCRHDREVCLPGGFPRYGPDIALVLVTDERSWNGFLDRFSVVEVGLALGQREYALFVFDDEAGIALGHRVRLFQDDVIPQRPAIGR